MNINGVALKINGIACNRMGTYAEQFKIAAEDNSITICIFDVLLCCPNKNQIALKLGTQIAFLNAWKLYFWLKRKGVNHQIGVSFTDKLVNATF